MRSYLKWKWYFPSEVTSFRRWLFTRDCTMIDFIKYHDIEIVWTSFWILLAILLVYFCAWMAIQPWKN